MVGAKDPDSYQLCWPYSKEEVRDRPYLRLRIGPTWNDVKALVRLVLTSVSGADFQQVSDGELSRLLDRHVDDGSVVPTFAQYGECTYRIYRKGETDAHEEAIEKICYAWSTSGKSLSDTRAAKILSILHFAPNSRDVMAVAAMERGTVAVFPQDLLDESTQIVAYMRRTGRLRSVTRDR